MTNTTQCPACQTRFKVSAAQLAAADGLVRCGRCAHVFNAKDHFLAPPAPSAEPATQPAQTPQAPAPQAIAPRAPAPMPEQPIGEIDDFELEVPDFDPQTAALPNDPLQNYPEDIGAIEQPNGPSSEDVAAFQQALNQALQQAPGNTPIGNPFADLGDEPIATPEVSAPAPVPEHQEDDGEVPAIFDTRRTVAPQEEKPEHTPEPAPESEAAWMPPVQTEAAVTQPPEDAPVKRRSPWLTAVLVLLSLIGLLLLAGQLVYINRTLIAAQAPQLRPALEGVCKQLGCKVPLPTDQEYIRTEWSELSFVPEHANLVQLSATLKNHALYPQALPVLEVTLRNAENQVLIRKVFTPQEYLKPENRKLQHFPANSELKLTMRFDVGNVHAQGYSLYWFYP
jgi:predicted Zn finger-like uncharacterized protein